jgi:hypothetical protein
MSRLYVFALTEQKAAPFVADGHRIEFVKTDGVYAAVERVAERPGVSEAALRTQHDVVARIAERVNALLPARFGAYVDPAELDVLTLRRRDAINEALTLVRGRGQMTVRLFQDEPPPHIAAPAPTTGTDYLERRAQSSAPHARPDALGPIGDAVRHIVAAERIDNGQGRIAATLYHLVDRNLLEQYKQALLPLRRRAGDSMMTVTGPWPPYAFVPELWV